MHAYTILYVYCACNVPHITHCFLTTTTFPQVSAEPFSNEDVQTFITSQEVMTKKHAANLGTMGVLLELFPW